MGSAAAAMAAAWVHDSLAAAAGGRLFALGRGVAARWRLSEASTAALDGGGDGGGAGPHARSGGGRRAARGFKADVGRPARARRPAATSTAGPQPTTETPDGQGRTRADPGGDGKPPRRPAATSTAGPQPTTETPDGQGRTRADPDKDAQCARPRQGPPQCARIPLTPCLRQPARPPPPRLTAVCATRPTPPPPR